MKKVKIYENAGEFSLEPIFGENQREFEYYLPDGFYVSNVNGIPHIFDADHNVCSICTDNTGPCVRPAIISKDINEPITLEVVPNIFGISIE